MFTRLNSFHIVASVFMLPRFTEHTCNDTASILSLENFCGWLKNSKIYLHYIVVSAISGGH